MHISDFNLEEKPNFSDYLKGGSEMHLTFALDFSSAKGHHAGDSEDQKLSEYEKAIQQVGNVVAEYDSDNLFPVYGFGGTPQGAEAISHCFHLNGEEENPSIEGIDNVLATYRKNLPGITIGKTTKFAPVLE